MAIGCHCAQGQEDSKVLLDEQGYALTLRLRAKCNRSKPGAKDSQVEGSGTGADTVPATTSEPLFNDKVGLVVKFWRPVLGRISSDSIEAL